MIDFIKSIDGIAYVIYIIVIVFFILALIGYLSERNKKIELSLNDDELNNKKNNNNTNSDLVGNSNVSSIVTPTSPITNNVSDVSLNTVSQQNSVTLNNNIMSDINTSIPIQSQVSTQLATVANSTQMNQLTNVGQTVSQQVILQPKAVSPQNNQSNNSINETQIPQPVIAINNTSNK